MVPSPESPPLTVGTLMLPSLETPSFCGPQVTSGSLEPISHVSQTLSSDRSHPQTSGSRRGMCCLTPLHSSGRVTPGMVAAVRVL